MITRFLKLFLPIFAFSELAGAQDFTNLGGEMTSPILGPAAIQVFAPNVTSVDRQLLQIEGFDPFHKTNQIEDGLGPRFINSSCGGCHFENGRGPITFNRSPLESGGAMVVKVKYPKKAIGPVISPVLQNHSITGETFHSLRLRWNTIEGYYPDGTKYKLKEPDLSFEIDGENYRKYAYSLRMSPPITGVGLIEAINVSSILARSDPKDKDKDGISGRPNIVTNLRDSNLTLGRFGFKAGQPTVEQQSAAALGNEMGISNTLFPVSEDLSIDFTDEQLTSVTIYQQLAGVPAARDQSNPKVIRGKELFFEVGCEGCHTSTYVTGENELPELSGQTIHPFSDFLLHNMGKGLADKHSEDSARGSEWRTTPLWGLGFSKYLSRLRAHYLHDGRASSIEQAILWHDGEAKNSKENFMALEKQDRKALIYFLRSL